MSTDTDPKQPVTVGADTYTFGPTLEWNGEHAFAALCAGLPPGTYGKVREVPLMRFEIETVNVETGVVTMQAANKDKP